MLTAVQGLRLIISQREEINILILLGMILAIVRVADTIRSPLLFMFDRLVLIFLALVPLLTVSAAAQEVAQGFLNIANMVPEEHPCSIHIGDKELVPGGLKEISATGWFIVPAGEHVMKLKIEGHKTASGRIKMEANASLLYVIFLQQISGNSEAEGEKKPPQLRIRRCEAFAVQKGHYLQAMSFCPEQERFHIGPHVLDIALFGTQEIPHWNGGAFQIMRGEKVIGSCAGSQEKGGYSLLIGSNHKRTYAALLVRNQTQELPPWMKAK